MINLRKIQISNTEPSTDVLWLKDDTAKYFNNGQWITIGGGSQEEEEIKQLSTKVSKLETNITSQKEQIINLTTTVQGYGTRIYNLEQSNIGDDYSYINRIVRDLVNEMDQERGDVYTRYCLGFYKGRVSQETIIASTAELRHYIQLGSAAYLNGYSTHYMEDYYEVSSDGIPTINIGTSGTKNDAWYFETNSLSFSFKSFGPTNCDLVGLRSDEKETTQFNGYVGLGMPVSTGENNMTLMANFSAVVFPE